MALADRHLIVEKGRIVFSGDSRTLQENPDILGRYLGI